MRLPGKKWLAEKHKTKGKRKSWRKLPLGLDLITGDIICSDLTLDDVSDPSALPGLLDQIGGPVDQFLADGAYDGGPTRELLRARFGEVADIIILPPRTAVLRPHAETGPTDRGRHIADIQTRGRIAWQRTTGYTQRSRGEIQMGRWKRVIGATLSARRLANQKTEAKIGVRVLTPMTGLAAPFSNAPHEFHLG